MTQYADDLSEHTNAEDTTTGSNFTRRWAAGAFTFDHQPSPEGQPSKLLRQASVTHNVNTEALWSSDLIDGDANNDDVEVLAIVAHQPDDGTSNDGLGVAARGSGASGTEQGYICQINRSAGNLEIGRIVGGSFTSIATSSATFSERTWYRIRFRVNGTTLQARAWADGTTEPGSWDISTTDANISGTGWAGFYYFPNDNGGALCYISFGTNGDSAPEPHTATLEPDVEIYQVGMQIVYEGTLSLVTDPPSFGSKNRSRVQVVG